MTHEFILTGTFTPSEAIELLEWVLDNHTHVTLSNPIHPLTLFEIRYHIENFLMKEPSAIVSKNLTLTINDDTIATIFKLRRRREKLFRCPCHKRVFERI